VPTRPKQHQLEDVSRRKFAEALPREWVFRDVSHDYGIDGEVEIFDEGGQATGLSFLVQLKATEAKRVSDRRRVKLKVEQLRYFKSRQVPVLIVRYDHVENRLFSRWAGRLDFYRLKPDAKHISFVVDEFDEWSAQTPIALECDVRRTRAVVHGQVKAPIRVRLDFAEIGITNREARLAISEVCAPTFGKLIEFVAAPEDNFDVELLVSGSDFVARIGHATCLTVHDFDIKIDEQVYVRLATYSVAATAAALAFLNCTQLSNRVLQAGGAGFLADIPEEASLFLVTKLVASVGVAHALQLVAEWLVNIDEETLSWVIGPLTICLLSSMEQKDAEAYERFLNLLVRLAEKSGSAISVGAAYYNLANFLRDQQRYGSALRCYRTAARSNPSYHTAGYFFKEVGACFFLAGRFRIAASCYSRALRAGIDDEVRFLYADALLFAGEYRRSMDEFSLIVEEGCNAEWILKLYVAKWLVENAKIESQERRKHASTLLFRPFAEVSEQQRSELLLDALQLDALNPLFAFNLGVQISSEADGMDHDSWIGAYHSFLIAAFGQPNDLESWINAMMCAFNNRELLGLFQLTARTAYYFIGERFLVALNDKFFSAAGDVVTEDFLAELEKMAVGEGAEHHGKSITLRGLDELGKVGLELVYHDDELERLAIDDG